MKPRQLVLGLDPGSRRTGYGMIGAGSRGIVRVASGIIRLDDSLPFAERLPGLREALLGLIREHRPSEAALETCFVSRGVRAALVLGHVRGVLMMICIEAGIPIYEYAPTAVKRAITGTGGASKEQVARMLERLLPDAPVDPGDDESDALAVAFCHLSRGDQGRSAGLRVAR